MRRCALSFYALMQRKNNSILRSRALILSRLDSLIARLWLLHGDDAVHMRAQHRCVNAPCAQPERARTAAFYDRARLDSFALQCANAPRTQRINASEQQHSTIARLDSFTLVIL